MAKWMVNQADWQYGNSIALVLRGAGEVNERQGDRSAVSFDTNPLQAPKLYVEYTVPAESEALFTDTFEAASLDQWDTVKNSVISVDAKRNGDYGVDLGVKGQIIKEITTIGLSNVTLAYKRFCNLGDVGKLRVDWSVNGGKWQKIEVTRKNAWRTKKFVLPEELNNQSLVKIRFVNIKAVEGQSSFLDDIKITATPDNPEHDLWAPSSTKKGFCIYPNKEAWVGKIEDLNAGWYYYWKPKMDLERPDGVEYVPMFKHVNDWYETNLKIVQNYIDNGMTHAVLAFNEPERDDQGDVTVQVALDNWPALEALNVPLVSPVGADDDAGRAWVADFMAGAEERGLRVDIMAMHWYGPANVTEFLNKVDALYALYQRPIWITEFAVADWQAQTLADNRYSPEQIYDFMNAIIPELEARDYVQRYSWYSDHTSEHLGTSALFNSINHTLQIQ